MKLLIYDGLNAKIKAMRGRLLRAEDYEALSALGGVEEIGRKLGDFPAYGAIISRMADDDFHRNIMERKLLLSLTEDYSRVYKYIPDYRIRRFLGGFCLYLEISMIKLLLCMVYDERDLVYTLPELSKMTGKRMGISVPKLMAAKTVPEFVEALEGTPYYAVLSGNFHGDASLFDMEMQLDLYYYMQLWSLANKLPGKGDRSVMRKIIGTEADLRNIMWIYRLKNGYGMDNAKIYTYLIPIHYRLSGEATVRMAEAADRDALMKELEASAYSAAFENFSSIDAVFYEQMSRVYAHAARMHPKTPAVTVAYIFSKQMEINNLTSLMECVRYGLGPQETARYLYL